MASNNFFCFRLFWVLGLVFLHHSLSSQEAMREALGKVIDSALNEISGMVASRKHTGHFWVHNDSGDEARFFLIDGHANLKATYYLENIEVHDLEDIAWLTIDNKPHLLLADMGDNRAVRKDIKLHLLEEPVFDESTKEYRVAKHQIQTFTLSYPDKARDAEALFVDPIDQCVYIISKRDFQSIVFSVKLFDKKNEEHLTLQPIQTLPFHFVTAADISADGKSILIKNLIQVFYYERKKGQTIAEAFSASYHTLNYLPEPQGEAIAFDLNKTDFYTLSERPFGLDAYLYKYKLWKK